MCWRKLKNASTLLSPRAWWRVKAGQPRNADLEASHTDLHSCRADAAHPANGGWLKSLLTVVLLGVKNRGVCCYPAPGFLYSSLVCFLFHSISRAYLRLIPVTSFHTLQTQEQLLLSPGQEKKRLGLFTSDKVQRTGKPCRVEDKKKEREHRTIGKGDVRRPVGLYRRYLLDYNCYRQTTSVRTR